MTAAPGVLQAEQLTLQYGNVVVLSGLDLTVRQGECIALIGGNGSGKSSLLRLMHGLVRPSAGRVTRTGLQRQAMVFQKPYMLRTSALNNVAWGLWLAGTPWRQTHALALQALARVGLADVAGRSGKTLSGGQQQRLALARAWAVQPELLFLDEPTASLDPHAKREVETLIAEFSRHMTLVFASHNLGQVKRLASRVVYLEQGRILADLPTQDFFNGSLLAQQYPAAHAFVKGETS